MGLWKKLRAAKNHFTSRSIVTNYQEGDLVYGLSVPPRARTYYLNQHLAAKRGEVRDDAGNTIYPVYVDALWDPEESFDERTFTKTNTIGLSKLDHYTERVTRQMRPTKRSSDYAQQIVAVGEHFAKHIESYDQELRGGQNNRQSPQHLDSEGGAVESKGHDQELQGGQNDKPSLQKLLDDVDTSTGAGKTDVFKRVSKLGIVNTYHRGNQIHFALDELNMDDVTRSKGNRDGHDHANSVTAKELRFIYRHREQLGDTVKFYRGGREVRAPWDARERTADSWNQYNTERLGRGKTDYTQTPRLSRRNYYSSRSE